MIQFTLITIQLKIQIQIQLHLQPTYNKYLSHNGNTTQIQMTCSIQMIFFSYLRNCANIWLELPVMTNYQHFPTKIRVIEQPWEKSQLIIIAFLLQMIMMILTSSRVVNWQQNKDHNTWYTDMVQIIIQIIIMMI